MSNNFISDPILKEIIVPIPKNHANPDANVAALILVILYFSINQITMGSISEMDDVHAAKINKIKNNVPNSCPPGIAPNATVIVSNSSPGPELISRPTSYNYWKYC